MANIKFSAFDATDPVSATIDLVAAKSGNNIRFTPADLAPFTGIYAANGAIGTTRKALITDTIQFRNAGDTLDMLSLNTNGIFTLGLGAVSSSEDNVVIGKDATDREAANAGNVIIGKGANLAATAGAEQYNVLIGRNATLDGNYNTCVGDSLVNTGGFNIAIGSGVNLVSNYSMGFGRSAKSTADNSITFNALSNQINTTNTVDNSFKVFMSSQTTPDLDVVGGGTSTLNTSLKVTGNMEVDGQAWGDLYDGGTIADGATFTPDWNNGNVQKIVIATGAAITIANGNNLNNGATYILIIEQAGTSGIVTWGGKYQFPAATPPVLSSGAAKADVITMLPYNSATILSSSTLDFLTA